MAGYDFGQARINSTKKSAKGGFSMAEMLVVMLVLTIVFLAATPLMVRRVKKETTKPEHGSFECYYDENDVLHQVQRDENAHVISESTPADGTCTFTPKRGTMFFIINAVGGGSPGSGTSTDFSHLPVGQWKSGGSFVESGNGANYFIESNDIHSIWFNTENNTPVNFTNVSDGILGGIGSSNNHPYRWLQGFGTNTGVDLKVLLTSNGGNLEFYRVGEDSNIKSDGLKPSTGFMEVKKKAETAEGVECDTNTPANLSWAPLAGTVGDGQYNTACYVDDKYYGNNPKPGNRILFTLEKVMQGMTFKDSEYIDTKDELDGKTYDGENSKHFEGNKIQGIGFGVAENATEEGTGCFIPEGAKGCYYYNGIDKNSYYRVDCTNSDYISKHTEMYDISEHIKCPTSAELKVNKGYCDHSTLIDPSKTGTDDTLLCRSGIGTYYTVDENLPLSQNMGIQLAPSDLGGNSYKPIDNVLTPNPNYIFRNKIVWGNFILLYQKMLKAINFYAQSGNPGEYRTIYMSTIDKTLEITPGAAKSFDRTATTDPEPGNDTIIKYVGSAEGDNLIVAKGGRAAYPSGDNGLTFMFGKIFEVPESIEGSVSAYNHGADDKSDNAYGFYFKQKPSEFIYPIPQGEGITPIPESVGQGGGGSYTINRLYGLSGSYFMEKFRGGNWQTRSSEVTHLTENHFSYTCQTDNSSISASNPRNVDGYRCYAGKGHGGAVVITW